MRSGTRASSVKSPASRARFSPSFPSMAIRSKSPRIGKPETQAPDLDGIARSIQDEVARHTAGGSMLAKIIGVIIATIIIGSIDAIRPFAIPFFIIALAIVFVIEGVRVVPQQSAWVIERLGKFHEALEPGLNVIIPFVDRVAYRHSLKEVPLDVPEQTCITKDNTQLAVDGVLYYQVTEPRLASYGSENYVAAITQLSQTTLRSEIGKMELDKTFESRDEINRQIEG